MGKSASGKDSIYNRIIEETDLPLKKVVPYTTRPIRSGEVDGESYYFCTNEEADALEVAGKVIEMRAYHTVHGLWKYFTADDGQMDLEKDSYVMIGTLEAYEKIRAYFGSDQVVPLYIWVETGERLARALGRERQQEEPKYAEMCRRFLADEEDFSEEKLAHAGIARRFENDDRERVFRELKEFIAEQI